MLCRTARDDRAHTRTHTHLHTHTYTHTQVHTHARAQVHSHRRKHARTHQPTLGAHGTRTSVHCVQPPPSAPRVQLHAQARVCSPLPPSDDAADPWRVYTRAPANGAPLAAAAAERQRVGAVAVSSRLASLGFFVGSITHRNGSIILFGQRDSGPVRLVALPSLSSPPPPPPPSSVV